jgi:hypothetical protein
MRRFTPRKHQSFSASLCKGAICWQTDHPLKLTKIKPAFLGEKVRFAFFFMYVMLITEIVLFFPSERALSAR